MASQTDRIEKKIVLKAPRSRVWRALADSKEFGAWFGASVTRQAITKHLPVLARAGLVRGTRRGREHVWELDPTQLAEARRYLDSISAQWDDALSRLKAFVER